MYRTKWRAEKGRWRVSICRDIGPHEFRASELVEGNQPSVEALCQAERVAMNRIVNAIIEMGGLL